MGYRFALSALAVLALPGAAAASDLSAIVATPMTGVFNDLRGPFERTSGRKVVAKFVSGPHVKSEVDAGRSFDVAISITPVINELVKDGKLIAATRVDVAYAPIGVGVRAGAPKPDISTVESFKRALLAAKSVAHSATGASGDHFQSILQRLGIADEMKPKLRPMPAGSIAQAVPSGQAEMIVVTASVILVPGAELVGPVPKELQFYNRFAAGVGLQSKDQSGAKDLLALLTSPASAAAYKTHGMVPGIP